MSKFIVSARKYRPTTFEEVVGQAHVADTLKNALQTDKLAHSFLFCGPRGVGKTTCARILAKVINCQNPVDKTQPCNECSSCSSFNDNASFNIIELDAASNNSVENIRNLIDQVRVPPQQGRYKVFIIDEVHMLSTAAFNAFLKTLEEPPAYAIFILATTEKHKILPTILSRCQIFDFKRIQVNDVSIQLADICRQEGITAEPEALHLIGQKADGAMRDALSIFDKVASAGGDTLTYKTVITNLNILDYEYYFRVVDAFLAEDLSKVLLIVDEVMNQGFDIDQFIQGLASHMRDLMVCKDQRTITLLDVSEGLKVRYTSQAQYATRSMLLSGLDILNQCDIALPRANNKRLYAEIALSKINFIQRTVDTHAVTDSSISQEKKTPYLTDSAPAEPIKEVPKSSPVEEVLVMDVKPPVASIPSPTESEASPVPVNPTVAQIPTAVPTPTVENVAPAAEVEQPTIPASSAPIKEANEAVTAEKNTAPDTSTEAKPPKASGTPAPNLDLLSIDNMMASLEAEDAAINAAKEKFGIEAITEIWEQYSQENPSPSVQTALNRVKLELQDESLMTIIVPTGIAGEIIINEVSLLDKIRTDLGVPGLIFKSKIDPDSFPDFEEVKKPVNLKASEKYQLMLDKKPELKKLISALDLKPDNESH